MRKTCSLSSTPNGASLVSDCSQHWKSSRSCTHLIQVTIAKIDAEANDFPDSDIRGFPTLILYDGLHTLKDMTDFIQDHGRHKAEVYLKGGPEEERILQSKQGRRFGGFFGWLGKK